MKRIHCAAVGAVFACVAVLGKARRWGPMAAGTLVGVVLASVTIGAAPPASALANHLAATPPMGWNDWNRFFCNVTESLVEQTADAMVANGMRAAGYKYVNVDDCWALPIRDANGNLVPDPTKFPNGIKPVADYVHSKGLKFGIYLSAGTRTCSPRGGFPGSLGHERQDAEMIAASGVDYLKYDNCYAPSNETTGQFIRRYSAMRDAIAATGRPIVYSISESGIKSPQKWAPRVANLWRTTGDIHDNYASMLSNFHGTVGLFSYSGKGAWNDPDMLEIGNGGMTIEEYRSEFTLWSEMAAPLIAGTELRGAVAPYLSIYTNREVIAVDQDPLGKQGVPVTSNSGHWVLSKPLANGDRAIVLFNETDQPAVIRTTAATVGVPTTRTYRLRDLWTHTTKSSSGIIRATVPPHNVAMYRVTAVGPLVPPVSASYEAESPSNHLRGGAKVRSCAACSRGSKVGWVGHGGTLTFYECLHRSRGQVPRRDRVLRWVKDGPPGDRRRERRRAGARAFHPDWELHEAGNPDSDDAPREGKQHDHVRESEGLRSRF